MHRAFPLLPDRAALKRVRTEAPLNFVPQRTESFARYHVVHSLKSEKPVRAISPFLVAKSLTDSIGPGYKATKMASGDLLLEVRDKLQHDKLASLKVFGDTPITVTPHRSLNTVRGVVSEIDFIDLTEGELLEGWQEQNVTEVRRIKIRRENNEIPTKHLIVTFASSTLPEFLESGYTKTRVRPYIPNPRRCFKCQKYGHGSQTCRGHLTCAKCGERIALLKTGKIHCNKL